MSTTTISSHGENSATEFLETDDEDEFNDVSLPSKSKSKKVSLIQLNLLADQQNSEDVQRVQRLHGGGDKSEDLDRVSLASMSSHGEDDYETTAQYAQDAQTAAQRKRRKIMRLAKITILFFIWLTFTGLLLVEEVHMLNKPNFICIPNGSDEKLYDTNEEATANTFIINIAGPFIMLTKQELRARGGNVRTLSIKLRQATTGALTADGKATRTLHDVSKTWILYISNASDLDNVSLVQREKRFTLRDMQKGTQDVGDSKRLHVSFRTNFAAPLPIEFQYEPVPVNVSTGVTIALLLVFGFYMLLACDIVHRALAIIVFCTLAIGMLALLGVRPPLRTIIDWINFEVLLLLFGFTLVIAILAETGIIDYLTVRIYQISNGHIWPILNVLCLFTAVGSALYDNILLILLTAPITMRICEVMELNPVPLLTCLIISTNIGGVLTPNDDTPYNFIRKNEFLARERVDWWVFVAHILPGTVIAGASAYMYMRLAYHDSNSMRFKDGAEVERLRRVIKVWSRTAKSISPYSRDEQAMRDTMMSKVRRLRRRLRRVGKMPKPAADFKETVRELRAQFHILDYSLLYKCCFVLLFIFIITTLRLFPNIHYLSTAWTVLLGFIVLLILADKQNFDGILGRIEWSTMLFLACVIVFTAATRQLGLFDAIGSLTYSAISHTTGTSARLSVAILIVLWTSAFSAALLTESTVGMMILHAVVVAIDDLEDDGGEHLPLQPLVWAVVLGTGLGGIGTIIGTYSNVICVGLAEKHGYNFPFLYYCKVGFPIMLVCVFSVTVYLMIAHVLCHWH